MSQSAKAFELHNLGRKKRRSKDDEFLWVLKDIDLEVFEGERLALVGPSGSGKSTLLRILADLEPFDEGSLSKDGKSILEIPAREYRRSVGYVQQAPALFEGTVGDNLRYGPALFGRSLSETEISSLLDSVGLSAKFAPMRADALSIGQKQRVAIARALSNSPKVLLMDEPTSALDRSAAEKIVRLVERLTREMGLTSIIVLHDLSLARGAVDRVAHIADGRLVSVSSAEEFFSKPPEPAVSSESQNSGGKEDE